MAIDQKDLNKDGSFWKEEEIIQQKALEHLRELKRLKVFDFHKLTPQTYDLKITGDPGGKVKATTGGKIDDDEKQEKKEEKKKEKESPEKGKKGKKGKKKKDAQQ